MTDRKLFGINTQIEDFTQRLTKVEVLEGGWSTKYLDEGSGLHWLKYVVEERVIHKYLMLISPAPTTDELIEIAFTSEFPDEVSAAATRLNLEERVDRKEYRQKLLDRLNEIDLRQLDKSEKGRLRTIVDAARLTDRVNNREILGKHFSEIQKDGQFFKAIADGAQDIQSRL